MMPAKYARIPGINLVSTLLRNIPLLPSKRRTAPKTRAIYSDAAKPVKPTKRATRRVIYGDAVKPVKPTKRATPRVIYGDAVKPVKPAKLATPKVIYADSVKPVKSAKLATPRVIYGDAVKPAKPAKLAPPRVICSDAAKPMKSAKLAQIDSTKVYVLQLEGGLIYVGQSKNVPRRIQQHLNGQGAVFTKRHKPTGVVLPRLGNVEGAGDSGERQEVLLQMRKHGMHLVRGWKYCNDKLSKPDVLDIQSNWIEMFNLCRRCMHPGHMASFCRAHKAI
jgi:hypothetical protein